MRAWRSGESPLSTGWRGPAPRSTTSPLPSTPRSHRYLMGSKGFAASAASQARSSLTTPNSRAQATLSRLNSVWLIEHLQDIREPAHVSDSSTDG
jgi:hypothetical protein